MRRLLNEKHESPLCTSTRESVCIPFRDIHGGETKQTIAFILHRWFVQSFKEVRAERELAWKSYAIADNSLLGPLDQRSSLLAISE